MATLTTIGARMIALQEMQEELARDFPGDNDIEMACAKLGNAVAYLRRKALGGPDGDPPSPAAELAAADQASAADSNGVAPAAEPAAADDMA